MNIEAIEQAIVAVKTNERYYNNMKSLIERISDHGNNRMAGTSTILSELFRVGPEWNTAEFGIFILPRDLLIDAIKVSLERLETTRRSAEANLIKLIEECKFVSETLEGDA